MANAANKAADKELPRILSITQAANIMGVSRGYVLRAKGQLPTIELNGKIKILRDPLLDLLNAKK